MWREQVEIKHRQGKGWGRGVKNFRGARQEEVKEMI